MSEFGGCQQFDSNLGWMPAIPEPFWYRGWRSLWQWKPMCPACNIRFKDKEEWKSHYALNHITRGR